jgi:hypothetical protein
LKSKIWPLTNLFAAAAAFRLLNGILTLRSRSACRCSAPNTRSSSPGEHPHRAVTSEHDRHACFSSERSNEDATNCHFTCLYSFPERSVPRTLRLRAMHLPLRNFYMIGTFFPKDSYFSELMWETAVGCSTRGVMLTAARLLINAIEDELACDLVPKARKRRNSGLRIELEQKILFVSGRRGHLVPFGSSELQPHPESGNTGSAKILPFKRHSTQTPETL